MLTFWILSGAAWTAVPSSGLVSHWAFDETSGTTFADSAGSNTGTRTDGAFHAAGMDAGAFDTRVLGRVSVSTSATLQPAALTASLWIKRLGNFSTGGGKKYFPIWAKANVWTSNGWFIELHDLDTEPDLAMLLAVDGGNGFYVGGDPNAFYPLNEWVHIAITFNAGTCAIYRNGVAQSVSTFGTPAAINPSADTTYLGAAYDDGTRGLPAAMDEVRIYDRALSAAEVLDLALERTAVWTGGGANDSWTTVANWQNSVAPVAGDNVVFQGATRTAPVNDYAAATAFRSVTCRDGGFNLTGNAVTLTNGVVSDGSTTYALATTLAADQSFTSSSGTLSLTGAVATAGYTLSFDGQADGNASGVISGSGSLRKLGNGVWDVTATNTYIGDTTLLFGGLRPTVNVIASTNGAFGNSANPVYLSGGYLSVNTATFSRPITALVGGGRVDAYGSARTVSAAIDISAVPDTPRGLVASIVLSPGDAMRSVTQDDWRLTQTIVGRRIDGQVLYTGSSWGSSAERAAYGIGGSDGDWNNYACQWDGWIRIPTDGIDLSTRSDDGSRVWLDFDGDGVIDAGEWGSNGWTNGQGDTTRMVHANVSAGVYRIRIQYEEGNGGNAMSLDWNYSAINGTHGQMQAVPTAAFCGFSVGGDFAGGAGGQDLTLTGAITGAGALTKTGTGTVILSGSVAYSGSTFGDGAGILRLAAANQLSDAMLLLESDSTLDCNGFNDTVGAVYGLGPITLGAATLTLGGTTTTLGGAGLYGGVISGTGAVVKATAGTQTLAGTGTYTGATTVSAGTLIAANIAALGTTAAGTSVTSGACLTIAGVAIGAEPVTLAGTGIASAGALLGTGTSSLSGPITLGAAASVATAGTLTLSGAIGGAFALTKAGGGVVELSASSTYTGATTISAGTLRLVGDTGRISTSSAVVLPSGATLDISSAGAANVDRIGDAVTVTMSGGTLVLTAPNNTNRTEAIGGLAFTGGVSQITMAPAGSGNAQLTAGTVARSNGGGLHFTRTPPSTGTGNLFLSDQVDNTVLAWTTVTKNSTQVGRYTTADGLIENITSVTVSTGNGTWSNAGNWDNGVPTSTVHAVIAAGHTITSDASADACASLELRGGTLAGSDAVAVVSGGITATATSSIAAPIAATPSTLAISPDTGTTLTISGAISGAVGVQKTLAGGLTLAGANGYTGATAIDAGLVTAADAAALGTTAAGTTVADGAALAISGVAIGAEALTLSGSGIGATGVLIGTGTASLAGAVALAADSVVGGTGALTLAGVVSGAAALTKVGAGTLTLSGDDTYSGATTVSVGTLVAAHANALGATAAGTTVASGATLDINGVTLAAEPISLAGTGVSVIGALTGTGTCAATGPITLSAATDIGGTGTLTLSGVVGGSGTLTKLGSGTLVLSGVNTYTGATALISGTARAAQNVVASTNGAFGNAASAVQLLGGALESATSTFSRAITVAEVGGRIDAYGSARTVASAVSLTTTGPGGLTGSYIASGLRSVTEDDWRSTRTIAGTRLDGPISFGSTAWGTALERAAFGIGGDDGNWENYSVQWDGYLRVVTTTTLSTRSDDNTRVWIDTDGDAVVDASEWGSNNWGSGGGQGDTTRSVSGALAPGIYRIRVQYEEGNGGNVMFLLWGDAANSAGTVDGIYLIPANHLSPAGFGLQLGGTTAAGAAGQTLTMSGVISGPGGIDKVGTSTVIMGNASTYAGPTTIIAGSLQLAAAERLPATAVVMASTGTFDLAGFSETVGSLAGAGTVSLGAGTLLCGADATSTSFTGAIGGSGGLTKQGAGMLTLSGTNTFTGATTISAGTIRVAGGAAIGDASEVAIADVAGAALDLNGSDEGIGALSGGGGTGGVVTLGAGRLTVAGSTTTAFDGVISGTGGLTRSGTGALTLSRASTYTGATTVAGGALYVNADNASSAVALSAGILGGTGTVGAITATASGLGEIRPGTAAAIGILKAASADFSNGLALRLRIAATAVAGTGYDRLDLGTAAGAVVLGGGSKLVLDLSSLAGLGVCTGVVTCAGLPGGTFGEVSSTGNPNRWRIGVDYRNAGRIDLQVVRSRAGNVVIGAPGTL